MKPDKNRMIMFSEHCC